MRQLIIILFIWTSGHITLLVLVLASIPQSGYGQTPDTLITHDRFIGIKLGETNFKDAGEILRPYSFKEPKLNFRRIKWRDGGLTILLTHYYFVKIDNSKLEVVLYGYTTVDRLQISCSERTALSFHNLVLGKSEIGELEFTGNKWEKIIDSNGKSFLTNEFRGIRVDIPGDTLDVKSRNWFNTRIKKITLSKEARQ